MVNVAILGFGTVGSGVADVLTRNSAVIDQRVDGLVRLKYILDVRDFPDSPYKDLFVKDFSVIENDPEVDVVVETIGGAKVALDFTQRALKAGKSVVSSNKELVATHGYDLLQLAKEHGVSYLFEASVGGGIPILRPLTACLAANELDQITGILNGTTNYILTRMIKAGLSFDQALKEAQANGYAEQDPTADVEGLDACRKICILAALAFGRHVYPEQVYTCGISGRVRKLDFRFTLSWAMRCRWPSMEATVTECEIVIFPRSKSTAPHRKPNTSLRRRPYKTAMVMGNSIGSPRRTPSNFRHSSGE